MGERVDESNSTDQILHPDKPGLLLRLGSDERLPNPAEVLLSKVNERVRNPLPGHRVLDSYDEVAENFSMRSMVSQALSCN
jgi:hypothetical protein